MKLRSIVIVCLVLLGLTSARAASLGTAFTYQGRLNDGGNPASGSYDLRFAVYDVAANGFPIAGPITNSVATVSNGLFTVTLDFGVGLFAGDARWLEIAVRTNGGGAFIPLAARQPLMPAPYAHYAPNAGTAATALGTAAGVVSNLSLATGAVTSDKIADGTLTAADLSPALASNTFWRLGGNSGTAPGTHFLGTTDNQPLELKVNGVRALRIEPNPTSAPNVIGGAPRNYVAAGVVGATIAGGSYHTIASNASYSAIGGGSQNTIQANAIASTIGGGYYNTIRTNTDRSTISGGEWNTIQSGADYSTIGGGYYNTNATNAAYATIPGGRYNFATNFSFAGGNRAQARHTGAFVWADSTDADFSSTDANQFLIRASGGVGIGTDSPTRMFQVTETTAGLLTYPLKTSNEGASAGTAVGLLFQVDGGGDRGKGALVYERTDTWNRGSFHFLQNRATDANVAGLSDAVMTIANNGNVGIGATAPEAPLDVEGNIFAGHEEGTFINYGNGNDATFKRVLGTRNRHAGFGAVEGTDIVSPVVWMYSQPGNSFTVMKMDYNAGTPDYIFWLMRVFPNGDLSVSGNAMAKEFRPFSDRNAKENFEAVPPREILAKVIDLPITRWTFKKHPDEQHIGPVAQDFHAAFGLGGDDDKHISTLDADGVALAAIQGLNQKLEEKEARIKELESRLEKLEQFLQASSGGAKR